jgi:hypothetical protein
MADEHNDEELRESAEAMGVEDTEDKTAGEVVEEVRRAQGDSTSSPTRPEWEEDGPRDDVAGSDE